MDFKPIRLERLYDCGKLSEKDESAFLTVLVEEILSKIVSYAFEQNGYTLESITSVCAKVLFKFLRRDISKEYVASAVSEHFDRYIQQVHTNKTFGLEKIPCRLCFNNFSRSSLQHGVFQKESGLTPEGIAIHYCFLCKDCVTEISHTFYGRMHKCALCDKRFSGYYHDKNISSEIIMNICPKCIGDDKAIAIEWERVKTHNSRAEYYSLPGVLTIKQWVDTLDHFNWSCAYCFGDFHGMEHYLPLSLGGGTTAKNCLPSCNRCNNRKKDNHPNKFVRLFPAENIARIQQYFASLP